MDSIVRSVAAGIGLTSEYLQHHHERKVAKKAATADESIKSDDAAAVGHYTQKSDTVHAQGRYLSTEDSAKYVDDEEQWKLDEVQGELTNVDLDTKKTHQSRDPKEITKRFTEDHPPTRAFEHAGLSLPVVLPQRRPKARTRGFIRAYAPELQGCDIDQETFLEFLETFNEATLASPWLDAINLASFAFVTLPTGISQALSIAIAISVDIAKNMQSRHRHDYILRQLNEDFFRPRGLYALVLTWNPESSERSIAVDLNQTIIDSLQPADGLLEKVKSSFRPSMGNTVGVAFSETAPLVFPELDSLVNDHSTEAKNFKEKVKKNKGLIAEYFDRRARAEYAGANPGSHLDVGPTPVFGSRYADPNHPSNSGSLISLLTGGKVNPPRRQGLLARRRAFVGSIISSTRSGVGRGQHDQTLPSWTKEGTYSTHRTQSGAGQGSASSFNAYPLGPGLIRYGVQRLFQHHVLYLAIINMPNEDELATAKEILKQAEAP